MRLAKTIDLKKTLLLALFVATFLLTRLPDLGMDSINPDAVNWHYRAEQFVVGLKHSQFEKTYQHYHPGVTLMWTVGAPIEIFKQITGISAYDQFSFYAFHYIAKISLVFAQLGLSLLLMYWLTKTIHFSKAYFTIFFLSLEPFFVGNSRMLHMDVLFALLVFASLVLSHLYIKEEKWYWAVLSGALLAFTFLTRSIGIGAYLYVAFAGAFYVYFKQKDLKAGVKFFGLITGVFVLFSFVFFPALWTEPVRVIGDIFAEGERIGIRKGHWQIFFGEYTRNPGLLFYPLILLLKTSPFLLIGVVLYGATLLKMLKHGLQNKEFVLLKKEKIVGFPTYALIFYIGYFVVMSFPSKKLDRYMVTLFPYISLLATFGFYFFLEKYHGMLRLARLGVLLIFANFVILPVFLFHPHQFTYTSPLFGSSENANSIVAQKPFGVGIFEVKEHLQANYGSVVEVGFIDTKPIKSIYPNSLVSDIRVNGVRAYDVLVLAVNEEMPQEVADSDANFVQDSSIYINGLEYWRFFVKGAE